MGADAPIPDHEGGRRPERRGRRILADSSQVNHRDGMIASPRRLQTLDILNRRQINPIKKTGNTSSSLLRGAPVAGQSVSGAPENVKKFSFRESSIKENPVIICGLF